MSTPDAVTSDEVALEEGGGSCIAADKVPANACIKVDGKCIPLAAPAAEAPAEAPVSVGRQVFAEFLGTMFLVATIIGSGMMGDNLSPDDGVALLGNTLATWGILYILISALGPISGAHFNPVVSMCFFLKRELAPALTAAFVVVQVGGAILGACVAHAMFMEKMRIADGKDRDTDGELFSEFVTTVGLLLTIFGGVAAKKDVGMMVGLFITAGYWFSSSTSFANPAVTIGRTFTDTFASISPKSYPAFFGGQALGLLGGLPLCEWLFGGKSVVGAVQTLFRIDAKKERSE